MITRIQNGRMFLKCDSCGSEFSTPWTQEQEENPFEADLKSFYAVVKCDACVKQQRDTEEQIRHQELKKYLIESIDDRMEQAGFPSAFVSLESPFIRHSAEWLYRNRKQSIFAGGETGTGKTSGTALVMRQMLLEYPLKVRYYTRQTFLADYTEAKTSNNPTESEKRFVGYLNTLDYIVIDEVIGRKGDSGLSDSAQEIFFNLIDGVYTNARKTRVWLLGNFYRGSIAKLLRTDDPYTLAPWYRRINECFQKVWFYPDRSEVVKNIE